MDDDILYEQTASTERIIAAFESLHHSDDDDEAGSSVNIYNCDYYQKAQSSSEDELNENTDTDDDIEDIITVVGANTAIIALLQKHRAQSLDYEPVS